MPRARLTSTVSRASPLLGRQPGRGPARRGHAGHRHRDLLHRGHRSLVRHHRGRHLHDHIGHPDHGKFPVRDRRHRRRHHHRPLRHQWHQPGRQVHLRERPGRDRGHPDQRVHDGGTSVSITGQTSTRPPPSASGLGAATSFTVSSGTSITAAISPAEAQGTVDITVTTPAGTSATSSADQFVFKVWPTVTAVSPTAGVPGGHLGHLTGTGSTGASAVKFGTVAGTGLVVNSSTSITVTAPAGSAGTVDVTVTTPVNTSVANPPGDQYPYEAAPTVTGVSPAAGLPAGAPM